MVAFMSGGLQSSNGHSFQIFSRPSLYHHYSSFLFNMPRVRKLYLLIIETQRYNLYFLIITLIYKYYIIKPLIYI